MRACKSCSPRSKACTRNRKPNCCKPCCLPRRRCQSLSPKRPTRQFYEQQSCSPSVGCDLSSFCNRCTPYDCTCSFRRRKCLREVCSPCQPRKCCFKDSICGNKCSLPIGCEPPLRCSNLTCDTFCPSKRNLCSPRPCDPCFPRRNPCYFRTYNHIDPCYPLSCRPRYYRTRDPYISCDPCYPLRCDLSCSPRRRQKFESCMTRKYCDPCYSPLNETCNPRPSETCRLKHGLSYDDSSGLSRLKLRDLRCDNFTKVCYPKDVPIKSCTIKNCMCDFRNCSCSTSNETACGDVGRVDCIRGVRDEGPSENFYRKSKRLGNSLDRYCAHFCPWEADVSISGTVRGHCTSTAMEVARRMSGRFRAEGDRYTVDSCDNKTPCLIGTQKMSLGRLDDGSALNFSRNNDPYKRITENKDCDAAEPNETLPLPQPSHNTIGGRRRSRSRRIEDRRYDENGCYSQAGMENSGIIGNTQSSVLSSCQRRSLDDDITTDQRQCSSRRSSHHSVRFGSENEDSDYKSASEMKNQPYPINNRSTSCSEVQHFLNSRKERQQNISQISSSTRDCSKETRLKSSSVQRADDQRYSPNSHSLRHRNADDSSDDDSPLFTPPTHCSSLESRKNAATKPLCDVDNIVLHSLNNEGHRTRNRYPECQEISLESNRVPTNRFRGLLREHEVDRIHENRRIREHY